MGPIRRPRYLVPGVAAALALAVVATWWIAASRPRPRQAPVAATAVEIEAEKVAKSPPPAPVVLSAKELVAGALELKASGDRTAAAAKLATALQADASYAEALYLQAALRGLEGDGAGAVEALDAYLKLEPDTRALGGRVEGDRDFDRVRGAAAFRSWLKEHGLVKKQPARPGPRDRPRGPRPSAAAPRPGPIPQPVPPAPAKEPEKKVDGLGLDLDI